MISKRKALEANSHSLVQYTDPLGLNPLYSPFKSEQVLQPVWAFVLGTTLARSIRTVVSCTHVSNLREREKDLPRGQNRKSAHSKSNKQEKETPDSRIHDVILPLESN